MSRTRNEIIDEATESYLANMTPQNHPTPARIAKELTENVEVAIEMENALRGKGMGITRQQTLTPDQIATIMAKIYYVRRIYYGEELDPEKDLLCIYMEEGPDKGTYESSKSKLFEIARRFNGRLTKRDFEEVIHVLYSIVPRVTPCWDVDLIPLNNGIFNYKTKVLEDFSPDKVFLAKSRVDYNHAATNVVFSNPEDNTVWDVESWMSELSDDPEVVELLWHIIGAALRTGVDWGKAVYLFNEDGCGGKGTFCALLRAIMGARTCTSISIKNFGKEFYLTSLLHASAVVCDENPVDFYVDDVAEFKAAVTHDPILVNIKNKTPVEMCFRGLIVECINSLPRYKDLSGSLARRMLLVKFDHSYTGKERKYIKDKYVKDKDVLEYVLYKVLNMPDYYTFPEPDSCKKLLDTYRTFTDPVRQCFEDIKDVAVWDLLPYQFLYEYYLEWMKRNNPGGKPEGRNKFIEHIRDVVKPSSEWYFRLKKDGTGAEEPAVKYGMNKPEPLILEYGLTNWMNKTYVGSEPNRICRPTLNQTYRGIVRYGSGAQGTSEPTETDSD